MVQNAEIPNILLDGWKMVWTTGTIYYEFWDDGEFIIRCTRQARDNILNKSELPLKSIDSEIEGILTDF